MLCDLVLVAGGKSARFNSEIPKQFLKILDRPLFMWSLEVFMSWPQMGNVILVVPEQWVEPVRNSFNNLINIKPIHVVSGGTSRQESSFLGLQKLRELSDNRWVMVHDAARPCIEISLLDSMWSVCQKHLFDEEFGGVIPAVKASETIKSVDASGRVKETLAREELRIVQTPQMLDRELLFKALVLFKDEQAVDDASLIEKLGRKVLVVDGSYDNLKVTFNEDMERVSNWLRKRHPQV